MSSTRELLEVDVVRVELRSCGLTVTNPPAGEKLDGPVTVAKVLTELLGRKDREHFVALHLNIKNRVVAAEIVSVGHLGATPVHPRESWNLVEVKSKVALTRDVVASS